MSALSLFPLFSPSGWRRSLSILVLSSAALIGGCGGGGGDDDVSTSEALQQASRHIVEVIDTEGNGLTGAGADSEALGALLEPLGITLADPGDGGLGDDLEDLVKLILDDDQSTVERQGDTLTITPSPQAVCDLLAAEVGFATDSALYDYCLDLVAELQIIIEIEDEDRGLLIVRFGASEPFTVRYAPGLLVVTLDAAESKAALDHLVLVLDPEATTDALDRIEGKLRLTLQVLGQDHGLILVEVAEDLVIVDESAPFDLQVAVSELLRIEADGVKGEASVSGGIGAITAHYPQDINDAGDTLPATAVLGGISFSVEVTEAGDSASGSFLVKPLSLTVDGTEVLALSVDDGSSGAVTFSATVDSEGEDLLTLTSGFDFDLVMNDGSYDLLGDFAPPGTAGQLRVTANSGTAIREYPLNPDLAEVTSGAVVFDGSGDFAGMTGTAGTGDCFNEEGPQLCAGGL